MTPEQEQRLKELTTAFLAENANINLSALRTEEACWNGNVMDSLPFIELIEQKIIPEPKTLIDVGTGGGFPLLPLAIMLPNAHCTGLDSIGKKIEAIKRIAKAIDLKNITLIAERTEILGRQRKNRDAYDVVTARAVAPLDTLLEYVAPFAKEGGHIVLWKSMHAEEELAKSAAAQKTLYCSLKHTHRYDLGGDWGTRQLLIFEKTGYTPDTYPREIGMAKKEPIA